MEKREKMKYDIIYYHSLNDDIKVNTNEVMRYMGQGEEDEKVRQLIESLIPLSIQKAKPKASFVMKKLTKKDDSLFFGNVTTKSASLKKALKDCEHVIVFAMTLGAEIDRLITSKASENSVCHALSAIATELMEEYADVVCDEIGAELKKDGLRLLPRFGVGYGDFSLDHQADIINMCEGYRRCGITTTDALMLVPSKSITGIMGIRKED